jgi:hypothetical protein
MRSGLSQMIAFGFENVLFLLFIAVALLFQLLSRVGAAASKDSEESEPEPPAPPRTPPTIRRPRPVTDEERVREFLEALGQPATSKPPPRVQPRPTYKKPVVLPHVPPFGSPLPPLTTRPPESEADWPLPHEIRLPGQIPPTRATKVFTPKAPDAPAYEVHESAMPLEPPPVAAKTAAEAYAVVTQPAQTPQRPATSIVALLRSTSGLREALVAREILGPPRSLQPLELI